MAKLGPGSMGIVAVLAMSGGVFYLAFRRANGLIRRPLFHNSVLNFWVWQGVQIPVLCDVLPAQTSNLDILDIPQQKFAKATDQDEARLSSEALKSDGDGLKENEKDQFLLDTPRSTSSTASSSPEPSSETTKQKKKVRFCESVVEPKGNNEEFRRNPKSKKMQGEGMAMVAQNRATRPDQKAILMRTGMVDRNGMVESLLGSKIQANRMALYSGMHRSMRARRLLLLTDY